MPDGRTETAVYLEDFDPIIYYCFFCARMALQEGQIVLEFDTFGVIQTTAFLLGIYTLKYFSAYYQIPPIRKIRLGVRCSPLFYLSALNKIRYI